MQDLFLNEEIMYNALIQKDSQYEGLFFIGVKTTGIFCRPTCTAKKPQRQNVEFFSTTKDALVNGYRPCKICNPLVKSGEAPHKIEELLQELESNPDLKINDQMLREKGLEPNQVRRWFQKNHGVTFQAYQRLMRLNHAISNIKMGESVTNAAYESGYDSLSGFQHTFKKVTENNPSEIGNKTIITTLRITTPIGPMVAGTTEKGICLLEFTDRHKLETEFNFLKKRYDAIILPGNNPLLNELCIQLEEYFDGKRKNFELLLDTPGTEFQQKVWKILQEIPYGATRSYTEQAISLGNIQAIRAVARANGDNHISIIIPCHRVIGANGDLVGYGGGIWRKKWLLELEQKNSNI
jgi:AraC family transcriptional regulator of adaptative response/methylated-DNA-[protein]-cysteine methyltransferase